MGERQTLAREVGAALRDHGLAAALTALAGGCLALAAAVTRRAFTNEAVLARLERELATERTRLDAQRLEDRKADAARLERIEDDIAAIRGLLLEAFRRRADP